MQLTTALAGVVTNRVEPAKQEIKKLETFRRLAVDILTEKKTFMQSIAPWAARVGRQPACQKIKTPCQWQVRTSRSASGTSLARLDEGRLKPFTALGLL
jgi:hypothetical protein